jgi:hypothetical protein
MRGINSGASVNRNQRMVFDGLIEKIVPTVAHRRLGFYGGFGFFLESRFINP